VIGGLAVVSNDSEEMCCMERRKGDGDRGDSLCASLMLGFEARQTSSLLVVEAWLCEAKLNLWRVEAGKEDSAVGKSKFTSKSPNTGKNLKAWPEPPEQINKLFTPGRKSINLQTNQREGE
jgi:hypothetical protein